MLTGDKGKTAKMIGVQCGMFSPGAKEDQESIIPDNRMDDDILEENRLQSSVSLKYRTNVIHTEERLVDPGTSDNVILFEVDGETTDIDS